MVAPVYLQIINLPFIPIILKHMHEGGSKSWKKYQHLQGWDTQLQRWRKHQEIFLYVLKDF